MPGAATLILVAFVAALPGAGDPLDDAFIARGGDIILLVDANRDGEYLDFAESSIFATVPAASLGALCPTDGGLLALDRAAGRVLLISDLNGDGDALDQFEVSDYAFLQPPATAYRGLARMSNGASLVAQQTTGTLIVIRDLNEDGDAFDAGEVDEVASGLQSPMSLAVRPDGAVLVSQATASIPVRILRDRDEDGRFDAFAENLSYAEAAIPGTDLIAVTDHLSILARPSAGEIIALVDKTLDDDVLDQNELLPFATGLAGSFLMGGNNRQLLLALNDGAGSVLLLRDNNADGDALDFGETSLVADGILQPLAICIQASDSGCIPGDVNGDGVVTAGDIAGFAAAVAAGTAQPCTIDINADGLIDGRDIQAFVVAAL